MPVSDVLAYPSARLDGASLRRNPGEVREAGLPQVCGVGSLPLPVGCSLGPGVSLLISAHSLVSWGPPKGDAVSSAPDLVGEVYHCAGQGLRQTAIGVLCSGHCRLGIRENRVAPAALAAGIEEPDGLEDRIDLCIENLLVGAQVLRRCV